MTHDLTAPITHPATPAVVRTEPRMSSRIALVGGTADISAARRFVRDTLADQGIGSAIVDDLALAASELVTNAVEHGDDHHVDLVLEVGPRAVRLAVTSRGNVSELAAGHRWVVADVSSATGRGLGIVRMLVDRVEIERQDDLLTITVSRQLPAA